jgi:hypothetical protein
MFKVGGGGMIMCVVFGIEEKQRMQKKEERQSRYCKRGSDLLVVVFWA